MNPLNLWRQEARELIPRGFLRRDKGNGLFVSDYPRHPGAEAVTESLRAAGFAVRRMGDMAHLDGTSEKYAALLTALPDATPRADRETLFLHSLARRLIRDETPLNQQPMALLRLTLKSLDAGEERLLYQKLSPQIALLQRQHRPLPAAAGRLILAKLTEEGEENRC